MKLKFLQQLSSINCRNPFLISLWNMLFVKILELEKHEVMSFNLVVHPALLRRQRNNARKDERNIF
jgi:hypothetical protein